MSIRSELNGKNVLVTGAASGIGRALTERFLDAGAAVAALDIDEPGLERLARDLSGRGRLAVIRCDLTNPEDIVTAAAEADSTVGPVDILVNNAGIVTGDHFVDLDDADLVRTFEVNILAPMRMTRALLPGMIQRGSGHIVTIASAGGLIATARLSAYSASKFAAVGFDEALRVEMKEAGHPIRTTLVCPYFIDTGMFAGVRSWFPLLPVLSTDRVADRIVRAVARKRRRLLMPWLVYLVFPLRLLPVG
ncbi:MAG: SDR family oxidoreductase, partial [Rhodothermales bacterium]|nr:SDR family oxidoreductase [Rhodothermales bacterium]